MKNLGYAIVFIFCSICAILGLCITKFYNTYIKNNKMVQILLYIVGFLLILKLCALLILPLVLSVVSDLIHSLNMGGAMNVYKNVILPFLSSAGGITIIGVASILILINFAGKE